MFICIDCGNNCLTEEGKQWGKMIMSIGPCEMCSKVRHCYDVSSSFDWAFKQSKPQTKQKHGIKSTRK